MEKLDAVNTALQAMGEFPVSELESGLPLASIAESKIDELNRRYQSEGWWFNEREREFTPDNDDKISVPSEVIRILRTRGEDNLHARDGYIFNPKDSTFDIGRPVTLRVVEERDWGDLPFEYQQFIAKLAGQELQRAYLGSSKLDRFTQDEVLRAWRQLHGREMEERQWNTNRGTSDMTRMTQRRSPL